MSKTTNRTPTHTTDENGNGIVIVPLGNHPNPARILREDFDRLTQDGITSQWYLNDNGGGLAYVRCKSHHQGGNNSTVARLILGTPKGQMIRYRDGNRLNLCRSNLYVEKDQRRRIGKRTASRALADVKSFAAAVARLA